MQVEEIKDEELKPLQLDRVYLSLGEWEHGFMLFHDLCLPLLSLTFAFLHYKRDELMTDVLITCELADEAEYYFRKTSVKRAQEALAEYRLFSTRKSERIHLMVLEPSIPALVKIKRKITKRRFLGIMFNI